MLRDLSIECDRMMALMPRTTIYLLDVCFARDVCLIAFAARRVRCDLSD
jgi:hypothetical protein